MRAMRLSTPLSPLSPLSQHNPLRHSFPPNHAPVAAHSPKPLSPIPRMRGTRSTYPRDHKAVPLTTRVRPVLCVDTRPEVLFPVPVFVAPPQTPRLGTQRTLTPVFLAPPTRSQGSSQSSSPVPRPRRPSPRRDAMEPRTADFVHFLQRMSAALHTDDDGAGVATSTGAGGGGTASTTAAAASTDAILSAFAVYFPTVARDARALAAAKQGTITECVAALNALVIAQVPPEGDPGLRQYEHRR
ncbi:hypothetical protein CspeluHIS016_0601820 [Cutaneotrichosporon spelunceum]|uniref:Uncharacterized protein n=1 Tax=Cutaneotrichosporon spelunceum TaxID=1672016 RepID=A0AAD3TXI5_9TREE|nr:hypothetical protein CspeluHIS016_0601820 [Cutaneotrichosporon spelunceum]